jgi:DNA repair protein RadC
MAEATVQQPERKRYPALPLLKVSMRGKIREPGAQYCNADSAVENLRKMTRLDREEFWILHLNAKNRLIGYEVVSTGSLSMSVVHPREVFKAAILNNSVSIICAHNHPSGDTTPSREDISTTKRLKKGADLLGIRLLDHIIIGHGGGFSSLAGMGHV